MPVLERHLSSAREVAAHLGLPADSSAASTTIKTTTTTTSTVTKKPD
jgi:hypothetical protein